MPMNCPKCYHTVFLDKSIQIEGKVAILNAPFQSDMSIQEQLHRCFYEDIYKKPPSANDYLDRSGVTQSIENQMKKVNPPPNYDQLKEVTKKTPTEVVTIASLLTEISGKQDKLIEAFNNLADAIKSLKNE
jgi:predicted nucleic-acid-binding Zn-ribbon protein